MEEPIPPTPQADSPSDLDLIAAFNGGDAQAFEALYRRHRDWAVNLAFRFTADRELALDVLQETFLYFLKKFPGFTLTARLQTFLYPVVKHLSLAARRKADRLQADDPALDNLVAPAPQVEGPTDALASALAGLPEARREVLLLRFVDGLSLAEIATALAIPLGTVKSRLHHALATLRQDQRTRDYFDA